MTQFEIIIDGWKQILHRYLTSEKVIMALSKKYPESASWKLSQGDREHALKLLSMLGNFLADNRA